MKLNFAKRMSYIKASEIREILKVTEREDVISFAGGCALTVMTYENSYLERITQLNNENIGNTLTLSAIGITLLYDLLKVK